MISNIFSAICDSIQCRHGGSCAISNGTATCACVLGYSGEFCKICKFRYFIKFHLRNSLINKKTRSMFVYF